MNQNPDGEARTSVRLETHWRLLSWAMLDKSLPLVFGLGFVLLVVRSLPQEEFGLQVLASTILLTVAQLLKALLLVPLTKFVAEAPHARRLATTGTLLYGLASAAVALALWGGRGAWAGIFGKPELAAVLTPTAAILLGAAGRDACTATLEGLRRLRTVFLLDLTYFLLALLGFAAWRFGGGPRRADTVQWVQAAAACLGTIVSLGVTRPVLTGRPSRDLAGRIARFGRFSFGSGAAATLQQYADQLLAGALMDARGVAVYGAAKYFFRGYNVVAQALNQVTMPVVSRLHAAGRREDLRVLFEKAVCFLYLAFIPASLALVLGSRPLFDLLFQGRYDASVPAFRVLVVSGLALPLASIASPFLIGLGEVKSLLWISWVGFLVGLGLAWVWIPRWGPVGAAAALLVAATAGMLARAWVLRPMLGYTTRGIVSRAGDAAAFLRRRLGSS